MKIELKHIAKKYPDAIPLRDVNATIYDGDVIAVIGPSGTGKSTLLRCINMLDPPTGGTIFADGLEITNNKTNFEKVRKKMGMVFQSFNLFTHLTVVENVMLALTSLKEMPRQKAYDIAMERLRDVGLEASALKYPEELSGGQKQRISIARTLAMSPELLLLDEPTSALDPTMVREVESVIVNLAKTGKTMMIVTHEMRLAKAISNRVFFLDKGELYEEGTPEQIFENPKRERTRAFVHNLKVLKYRFCAEEFCYEDCMAKFLTYIENNAIEQIAASKLKIAVEALATELVPNHLHEKTVFSILAEYNPETKNTTLIVYSSEAETNVVAEIENLLMPIALSVQSTTVFDEDFSRKTTCVF